MSKNYRLYELSYDQFVEFVGKLCMLILETGTVVFTKEISKAGIKKMSKHDGCYFKKEDWHRRI